MKKAFFILIMVLYLGSNPATAQYSVLFDFSETEGQFPKSALTLSSDVLYGMTTNGGTNDLGCIFRINTDGTGYTKLLDFSGTSNGSYPQGFLTLSDNVLYGMTWAGGTQDLGCIFKINTDGSGFTKLYDFGGTAIGSYPTGSLTISGNALYGMTSRGGANDLGCIFIINTDGTGYTQLYDFSGTADGDTPYASLTLSGNVLYGMTAWGGTNDLGCIFKINTDGSGYTPLLYFDGTENGGNPYGSLTISEDVLYGMTKNGGADNIGCIFKLNTDGTGYTKLFDFSGEVDGSYPFGSLIISGDVLYGMTWMGGTNDLGCIFQFNTMTNEFSTLWDFVDNEGGKYPYGDLTISGSTLYGVTGYGGANTCGVIFQYFLVPDTQTSNITFPFVGISVTNISWTNGNGEKRAVFIKEGTGTITDPDNNTIYSASNDWDSKGSQLGTSGYYCVYNDTGTMVSVNNLTPGTTYTVQAYEYNGEAGNEQYLLDTETGNPNTFQTESMNAIQTNRDNPVQIYSYGNDIYAVIDYCDTKAKLSVYNLSGNCIISEYNLVEGQNKITGNFHPGVYIIKLVLDDRLYTQKVSIHK